MFVCPPDSSGFIWFLIRIRFQVHLDSLIRRFRIRSAALCGGLLAHNQVAWSSSNLCVPCFSIRLGAGRSETGKSGNNSIRCQNLKPQHLLASWGAWFRTLSRSTDSPVSSGAGAAESLALQAPKANERHAGALISLSLSRLEGHRSDDQRRWMA